MSRDEYDTHDMSGERVSVHEAALRLGISDGAVRKRVERGSLEGDREDDGRLYVWLDAVADASHDGSHEGSRTTPGTDPTGEHGTGQDLGGAKEVYEARIADLREQLEYFRAEMERRGEEAERKDRIIAGLAQSNAELASTVRALEPAAESASQEPAAEPATEPDRDTGAAGGGSEDSDGQPYPREGNSTGSPQGGVHEGAVRGSGYPNSAAGSASTKKPGGLLRLIVEYLRK